MSMFDVSLCPDGRVLPGPQEEGTQAGEGEHAPGGGAPAQHVQQQQCQQQHQALDRLQPGDSLALPRGPAPRPAGEGGGEGVQQRRGRHASQRGECRPAGARAHGAREEGAEGAEGVPGAGEASTLTRKNSLSRDSFASDMEGIASAVGLRSVSAASRLLNGVSCSGIWVDSPYDWAGLHCDGLGCPVFGLAYHLLGLSPGPELPREEIELHSSTELLRSLAARENGPGLSSPGEWPWAGSRL